MEKIGVVDRVDESTEYCIGRGLVEMTGAHEGSAVLLTAARPHLIRLSGVLGEAVGLAIPEGYSALYLCQVESPQPIQVRDYSGLSTPMHIVPAGLCVMAEWPLDEVQRYLSRPLEAYTAQTVIDPAVILNRLESARKLGYAHLDEEFAEGLSSVAAPIRDRHGRVVGAFNVHGPTYRFPRIMGLEQVGLLVREAAERFSGRSF
jgi:DNA-binding IclR family transcriptional regulator